MSHSEALSPKMAKLQNATIAVILFNTLLLAWSMFDHANEHMIEGFETGCLAFFVIELGMRIDDKGWKQFFSEGWSIFDTAVIVVSLLPVLGMHMSVLRVAKVARLVHLSRHISHLRLLDLVWMKWKKGRDDKRAV
jgi:voltage-gated sodium channel